MSKENSKNESNYKQSFKAVENFLRRIAFNLGNTQSRTEVKIISCIPIDVTDLQQRIFQLQNELADVKAKEPPKICATGVKRGEASPKQVFCNECLLSATSVLSVFCPGTCSSVELRRGSVERDRNHCGKTEDASRNRSFFTKKKKTHKKKAKNRLVYCAQTNTNNPFMNKLSKGNKIVPMKTKPNNKRENPNRSYLNDVIKRQYIHRPLVNEFSNFSDISSPVCRDHVPAMSPNSPYIESDACSCVHGNFQNVDNYMNHKNQLNKYSTYATVETFDRNAYYDSKFYDLVPVKEKITKHRNNIDKRKVKEPKRHVIECWPENARPKARVDPVVVNYCTVSTLRDEHAWYPASAPRSPRGYVPLDGRLVASTPRRPTELELGPVYAKPVRKHKKDNTITTTGRHNVATESPDKDIAARQAATTAATITDPPEDKTETTLNLIKTMLQSVLTEVKTNGHSTNPPAQEKKDAVVQNGPARGYDYGASQLLQSYTYSPYNMTPFMPSCSHPISCGNYGCPEFSGPQNLPYQQYPLLIQPQKHLCNNNYYRNTHYNKPATKRAASAATNTEQAQERSKETAQLIKEIYKSMALNMEESSKDNSIRAYTKPNTIVNNSAAMVKTDSDRESRSIAQAISEIFRNTHPRDSTVTGTTDSTLNSYLNPNKQGAMPEKAVKKEYKTDRNSTPTGHATINTYRKDRESVRMSTHHETEEQSDSDDTVVEDTEGSTTETEVPHVTAIKKEHAIPAEPKKEKSGIFKKMLKIFQPRRRKRRSDDVAHGSEKESESDSDDYQTVYSHKVVDSPKPKKSIVRSRPHSKVFNSKQPQVRKSRTKSPEVYTKATPYMEQEYRRYWDEKLMFHANPHQKQAATSPRQTDRDQRYRYAHYQNYEARPMLIEPMRRGPVGMAGNVMRPRFTTHNHSSRTKHAAYGPEVRYNHTENNSLQSNTATMKVMNTGAAGPHFVTSKSAATRKGMSAKEWMKKCKPQCAQQWKDLVING